MMNDPERGGLSRVRLTEQLGGCRPERKDMSMSWNCPKTDKPCWQNCRGFECRDRDDARVTCGGGLPGDPNGEQAALAVEVLARKYDGAMPRERLREAFHARGYVP